MKKYCLILLVALTIFFQGSGYKGTLPDLNIKEVLQIKNEPQNAPVPDILPLDKLTMPVNATRKIDKTLINYTDEMKDVIRQLERIKEVLDTDKSFKNFVAASNVFNLCTQNILDKYTEERFAHTNKILSDINYDIQQIKRYWIQINKNAPYVSSYKTNNAYSAEVLNKELNSFSNVLTYAIRELKSNFKME